MPKASEIPDSDIQQMGSDARAIHYRVGQNIRVVSLKNSTNRWVFTCMTCRTTDSCHHTRAVRRYYGHPLKRLYEDDAA